MKYYRVTADYRKKEPHPTYDFCVEDGITAKEIKEWFKMIYTWLDIYSINEIKPEEAKYAMILKQVHKDATKL